MTRDAYVDEFVRNIRSKSYREAFNLFIRYGEDLITQLRGDEALFAFNGFRDAGMEAQAKGLYTNLHRHGLRDNSQVMTIDDLAEFLDIDLPPEL